MIKILGAGLVLISLSGCDLIFDAIFDPNHVDERCEGNEIPQTPADATDAQVEAEIIAMCRDQER